MNSSQCDRILAALTEQVNQWVAMPALARAASPTGEGQGLAVHSRIADLRKRGNFIAQKCEERDGQKWSFYKLVVGSAATEEVVGECVAPVE